MNNPNRRLFQTRENFTFRDKKIFSLIPNLNEAGIKENLAENPRFLQLARVRKSSTSSSVGSVGLLSSLQEILEIFTIGNRA